MLSVLTLTWLKALTQGAEDLFDGALKRTPSRLHPCSVMHQSCGPCGLQCCFNTCNLMQITNPANITINTNTDLKLVFCVFILCLCTGFRFVFSIDNTSPQPTKVVFISVFFVFILEI